ncbi:MAG: hypothetical protein ACP5D3_07900, partial [Sulfurovum sp.]
IMIPLKMQEARAFRYIIQDPSQARERDKVAVQASNCQWAFTSLSANYFGRKPLVLKDSETEIKELRERRFSLIQRNVLEPMGSIIKISVVWFLGESGQVKAG